MKLAALFVLIHSIAFLSTNLYSQSKKSMDVGIIAGANYSGVFVDIPQYNIGEEQSVNVEDFYKYRFGYFGGVTFSYTFNNYFGIGGDLIYTLKGYDYDNSNDQKNYIRLHYLEIPFLVNFYFLQKPQLTSYLYLGPYISYLLDGRYEYESSFYSSDGKLEGIDDFDYGITAGVSFLIPVQAYKVGIDLKYDWGINNTFKSGYWNIYGEEPSFKNSSLMLGVKFLFNIKTKSSFEEENTEGDDTIWR
jgi:hypothetical protein